VLFAWDDKRGGDVVFAAGWNAKVGSATLVADSASTVLAHCSCR
jgi:hypothetical protein